MVAIDFYAFGVPYGFSITASGDSDNHQHIKYLEGFYNSPFTDDSGRQMIVKKMSNGSVFYSLIISPDKGQVFTDVNGRSGSFFGISLVLTNQQFKDPKKVWVCLNNIYNESIRGNIVEDTDMYKRYKVRNLNTPQIIQFVQNAIQKEFSKGLLRGEVVDLKYNEQDKTNFQWFRVSVNTNAAQQNTGR